MKRIVQGLLVIASLHAASSFAGDAAEGAKLAPTCAACHQLDGNSTTPMWPKVSGQHESYLIKQLKEFRLSNQDNSKGRYDPAMSPMAANLSDDDIANLAAYYSSQEIQLAAVPNEFVELGERIYRAGDPARNVPACSACHGPTGAGLELAVYPSVSGQHAEYTINTLKAFAKGKRNNDTNRVMRDIASRMTEEQMEAVANYMMGLH